MIRIKLLFSYLILHLAFVSSSQIVKSDDIAGVWLTSNGKSKITIFRNGNYFYGKIAWLKEPNSEAGKPKVDEKNPNVKLRTRPILGLLLLKGFEFDEKNNEWTNGEIYDPKSGKIYSCTISLTNRSTLKVRGYIGISLIGRTDVWTRTE